MNYLEFAELPFYKQVHSCSLLYCRVNGLPTFVNKKPSKDYFKVRSYFMKPDGIPRQHIKNIWKWLDEKHERCSIYDADKFASRYIAQEQEKAAKEKLKEIKVKDYEIDLEGFLA